MAIQKTFPTMIRRASLTAFMAFTLSACGGGSASDPVLPPANIVPAGPKVQVPSLSILAGSTSASPATQVDGPGTIASFQSPAGLALDAAGNVYVEDFNAV